MLKEGDHCQAFIPLTPDQVAENKAFFEREDALRFHIWNTLALGAEGFDMSEEFDAVGQEIGEVSSIRGLGRDQLVPLVELGRNDTDVRFLYEAMASAGKGAPLSKRREFVGVNRALITLESLSGSYEDHQVSVERMVDVYMQSIRPQALEGLKKFWNVAHADSEMRLLLLPLTPLGPDSLAE